MRKHFLKVNTHPTVHSAKNELEHINKILESKEVDDLSAEQLNDLAFYCERLALSFREWNENNHIYNLKWAVLDEKKTTFNKEEMDIFYSENPLIFAEVLDYNGVPIVHVQTPYLFRKELRRAFTIANYLEAFIDYNETFNDLCFRKDNKKYMLYIIRCTKKFNKSAHCDNDNVEASRIINVIFSRLGISDNPNRMSMLCDYVIDDDVDLLGTHFFVLPYEEDLPNGQTLINHLKNAKKQ